MGIVTDAQSKALAMTGAYVGAYNSQGNGIYGLYGYQYYISDAKYSSQLRLHYNTGTIETRTCKDGVWGAWQSYATNTDLDTTTIRNYATSGRLGLDYNPDSHALILYLDSKNQETIVTKSDIAEKSMAAVYYKNNNLVIANIATAKYYVTINLDNNIMVVDSNGISNSYDLSSLKRT